MYLSRLVLNPQDPLVQRALTDCQLLHRCLMTAFPQSATPEARAEYGILHRLDQDPRTGAASALVQSAVRPDWVHLPPGFLAPGATPAVRPLAQRLDAIEAGEILPFVLVANPTRKIDSKSEPSGPKRNGRRVPLDPDDQVAWLHRKAQDGGFALLAVAREANTQRGRHPTGPLTFDSVRFEGELQVTDPDRFRETLMLGLGSGKAYGNGLLTVGL